jgi:ABC-type ATPase with predicted acetyltransferase domain
MDLRIEKEFIKTEIDKTDDVHIVEAIKNILALGKAKEYENSLRPMSISQFHERNKLSQKSIKKNQLIDQKDAKSFFEKKHAQS